MNNEKMKNHLENADMDKLAAVLEIKKAYNDGKYSLEEARSLLKERVTTLTPEEIALAEQELTDDDDDQCRKEDIQKMMELFDGILVTGRPKLPEGHPILRYFEENDEMRKLLRAVEDLVQYPVIKNQWFELYDKLREFRIHLSRKQNQLYPMLEKKGFTRPTTTMWTLDDFIRDEISEFRGLLEEGKEDEFIEKQTTLVYDVEDLMSKEETILYPTSLKLINQGEFEDMKSGDLEIGFAFGVGGSKEEVKEAGIKGISGKPVNEGFINELAGLLGKYGFASGNDEELDVNTGKLTLNQINMIFQNLPLDISFVDENEIVKFYSDTDHRIFPRSKNVIGRDVKNCHPRKSVHLVEEIIEKFRKGDEAVIKTDKNEADEVMNEAHKKVTDESEIEVTPDTKLTELLAICPRLKEELPKINPKFKMLNSPLGRVMIPKATVKIMSERSEMDLNVLIEAIKKVIEK